MNGAAHRSSLRWHYPDQVLVGSTAPLPSAAAVLSARRTARAPRCIVGNERTGRGRNSSQPTAGRQERLFGTRLAKHPLSGGHM